MLNIPIVLSQLPYTPLRKASLEKKTDNCATLNSSIAWRTPSGRRAGHRLEAKNREMFEGLEFPEKNRKKLNPSVKQPIGSWQYCGIMFRIIFIQTNNYYPYEISSPVLRFNCFFCTSG